jgi:hypothetical protein
VVGGHPALIASCMERLEHPPDIQHKVVSFSNPAGTLTNSDLEMAGMLVHYLVLEHLVSLRHMHVAAWCDNTPTVSWTNKLSSSRSQVAGHLTWALAMHLHANEASPLVSVSIASKQTKWRTQPPVHSAANPPHLTPFKSLTVKSFIHSLLHFLSRPALGASSA